VTKAIDAKVGDKEICKSCGTEVTCGLTKGTAEYPSKNQWQVDGKAHYNYDFKSKTTTCNNVIIEDPKNKRAPTNLLIEEHQITPEILRQESFSDFEKVYSEGFIKAKLLVDSLRVGVTDDPEVRFSIATLITRKYVDFYTARNF